MPFSFNFFSKKTAVALAVFMALAAVFVFLPQLASAQASLGLEITGSTGLGTRDLKDLIVQIVNIVLGFLGIVAVIVILYGGFIWMTAGGEAEKIEKAKKIIINAAIGLAIILSAYGIVMFVVSRFGAATEQPLNGPGGNQGGYEQGWGALGAGVLKEVYPEPGAGEVPRNTLIMVTFKEEMATSSIIDTANLPAVCQGLPQGDCGFLKTAHNQPTVRIINRSDNNNVLAANQVVVMTNNRKSFVFNPEPLLGNAGGYTDYSVNLTDQIAKAGGQPAFMAGGYTWSFQVSNITDVTPPKIISVVPASGQTVFRNAVVQINFSEAMNVIGATGQAMVSQDNQLTGESFKNINFRYPENNQTKFLSGNFGISNQFRTVEFVTDSPCPLPEGQRVNSCGEVPYCLPPSAQLAALAKAAIVSAQTKETLDIFSGLTDAAGNSLDGGGLNGAASNGQADGRPADDQDQFVAENNDNYWWSFSTNNRLDLTPPRISNIEPVQGSALVPKNSQIKADFNKLIRSETLSSDNFKVFKFECNGDDFPEDLSCYPVGGFSIAKENAGEGTAAILRTYAPYLDPLTVYNPRLTAGIQDLYQNCFKPSRGPCTAGQVSPNCQ
ncbi:MAG: Ig-like domain-containing protein [Candidatus Komeilibacteria bacterium]|nr:Ig-like domain-containing protein [Candidatus Komeilibacteria bacterium]